MMKKLILLAALCLGASVNAPAALTIATYATGFENGGVILDGNTSPWSDTRTVSGIMESSIASVSVTLNVSGGYNGDLYAYLSYNGSRVVLLNRVGMGTGSNPNPVYSFGYSGAGFTDLVLQDGASDIHAYGDGVGTGAFSPDGRDISPLSNPSVLYATSRATLDGTFGGMNPNGDWTLVFADLTGGNQSTVVSWGLEIGTAPEPVTVALGIFGGLFAVVLLARRLRPGGVTGRG